MAQHSGGSSSGRSGSPSANEALKSIADKFKAEQPKLAAGIKNYLSHVTALSMSSGSNQHVPVDSSGAAAAAAAAVELAAKPMHIIAVSRYVLNGLNDPALLPTPVEFGSRYPQDDSQLGMDRIDELAKYKVAFTLGHTLQQQGHKRTQYFGRSYFTTTRIWSDLEKYVQRRVENDKAKLWSSPDGLAEFPAAYMRGLRDTLAEDPEDSLVWCRDLSEVLRKRQTERQDRAAKVAAASASTPSPDSTTSVSASTIEHANTAAQEAGGDADSKGAPSR